MVCLVFQLSVIITWGVITWGVGFISIWWALIVSFSSWHEHFSLGRGWLGHFVWCNRALLKKSGVILSGCAHQTHLVYSAPVDAPCTVYGSVFMHRVHSGRGGYDMVSVRVYYLIPVQIYSYI